MMDIDFYFECVQFAFRIGKISQWIIIKIVLAFDKVAGFLLIRKASKFLC